MCSLKNFKLHYLPVISCCWFVITFATTYSVAIFYQHVYPVLPYISETGSEPPESCIFGQMLNIGAFILGLNNYVRYRQVDFAISSNNIGLRKTWNELSLWCGNVVCLGITLVGNFQQNSVLHIHLIGAFITIGGTAVFFILQTRISFGLRNYYRKYPQYGVGDYVLYFRIFTTVCYIILFIILCVFSFVSVEEFTGVDSKFWTNEHGGYYLHLLSTSSEWFLFIALVSYILSVTKEFKSLQFQEIIFVNRCRADTDDSTV